MKTIIMVKGCPECGEEVKHSYVDFTDGETTEVDLDMSVEQSSWTCKCGCNFGICLDVEIF